MDSNQTIDEIELLVRSKRTVLYLVSQEENRVMSALESLCSKDDTSWDLLKWDLVVLEIHQLLCLIILVHT